jgi:hypothetical protein
MHETDNGKVYMVNIDKLHEWHENRGIWVGVPPAFRMSIEELIELQYRHAYDRVREIMSKPWHD